MICHLTAPFARRRLRPTGCRPWSRRAAFTMVEIVISLGVISVGLIAILGVLPAGVRVQQQNREDTIINQDGMFLLEAIRSGAEGLDDLTNYVQRITIQNFELGGRRGVTPTEKLVYETRPVATPGALDLLTGRHIIGLLSTPSFYVTNNGLIASWSNSVTAKVRAISGVAGEKEYIPNADSDAADLVQFYYQLTCEIRPLLAVPVIANSNLFNLQANYQINFNEIRLTFRWPLIERADGDFVGNNKRTFRAIVGGRLLLTNDFLRPYNLHFFRPGEYVRFQESR